MVLRKAEFKKGWCVSGGSSFSSCVIAVVVKELDFLLLTMGRDVLSVEQEAGSAVLHVGLCRRSPAVFRVKQLAWL